MRIDRIKLVTELTMQGMTQKELAERSGISRATVNNIKCGKSCSKEIAEKISIGLGVKLERLLEK